MSFDPAVCLKQLTDKGFVPTCDTGTSMGSHCEAFMTTPLYHDNCAKQNMYAPVPWICCQNATTQEIKCFTLETVLPECTKLHDANPAWNPVSCFCCCACFARDTLVGTPAGPVEIFTLGVGDLVLVGSVTRGATGVSVDWKPGMVSFSAGTGPGGEQGVMVYLAYGNPNDPQDVICSPDQPFLLASGGYAQAKTLPPGDQLVAIDGSTTTLLLASIGSYHGGVHHIATDLPWNDSADGHWIQAGGLVAGDFEFQMNFDGLPDDDIQARPMIGTPEYEAALGPRVLRATSRVLFGAEPGSGE